MITLININLDRVGYNTWLDFESRVSSLDSTWRTTGLTIGMTERERSAGGMDWLDRGLASLVVAKEGGKGRKERDMAVITGGQYECAARTYAFVL